MTTLVRSCGIVVWALARLLLLGAPTHGVAAEVEDVVIASSATDPDIRSRRTGKILDYTGNELKLRTTLGREETIPTVRIAEIQTVWSAEHQAGNAARSAGKLDEAIESYGRARREEPRGWGRRQIQAELAGTYLEAGRIVDACDEFLAIVAGDPATPHYEAIPIAWRAAVPNGVLEGRAEAWIAPDQPPAARLLGASWLLPGSERGAAIAALEQLERLDDLQIRGLARVQLWRTKLVTAKPGEIAAWEYQLQDMPLSIQAVGWYVIGELRARRDEHQQAALAYLKVPLLFRRQRAMSADALLAAAKQLATMEQTEPAAGLLEEVVRDFGHMPAATEARSLLAKRATPAAP
ncbi:MAG: hypothetical protein WD872_02750 [Pirellulaceae bacterium]